MSERILFISPYCGQIENALSKHSNIIIEDLKKHYELDILTSRTAHLRHPAENTCLLDDWKQSELLKARKFLIKRAPTKVIFQYVPNMYNPRGGINLTFSSFISSIPKNIEVIGIFHELYYPLLLELRSFVLHPTHRYQLKVHLERCDRVVTTTEEFAQIINKINDKKHAVVLPAYSNILKMSQECEVASKKIKLAFIGGLHPSKKIEQTIKFLSKHPDFQSKFEINIFGISSDQLASPHGENLKFHGHLPDRDYSHELSCCDLVIAYFSDGLSTRRGSVMTALQHGIPVVSSVPRQGNLYDFNCPGITLLPRDFRKFQPQLESFLHSFKRVESTIKTQIETYYESTFSAHKIIERLRKDVLTSV